MKFLFIFYIIFFLFFSFFNNTFWADKNPVCDKKVRILEFNKPDIKNSFCWIKIKFWYCKCAFHGTYCETARMDKSSANNFVQWQYNTRIWELKKKFQEKCEIDWKIINDGNACEKCNSPFFRESWKCVHPDKERLKEMIKDNPVNNDCKIKDNDFDKDWTKYSDIDEIIPINERSFEAQKVDEYQNQIIKLSKENFILQRDREIDRRSRLFLKDFRSKLVHSQKVNLLKSFWRLSFITYQTIQSWKWAAGSYSSVITRWEWLKEWVKALGEWLKFIKSMVPKNQNSSLEIDTSTTGGKIKNIGVDIAFETLATLGDPIKIWTEFINSSSNVILPSADITEEEVQILRDQYLGSRFLDEVIQESYKENVLRKKREEEIEAKIKETQKKVTGYEWQEKERVKNNLINLCKKLLANAEC